MVDVRALVIVVHLCRTMGQLRCVHCTGAQVAQTQVSSNVTGPLSHPLGNRMAIFIFCMYTCRCAGVSMCAHAYVHVCVHVHVCGKLTGIFTVALSSYVFMQAGQP